MSPRACRLCSLVATFSAGAYTIARVPTVRLEAHPHGQRRGKERASEQLKKPCGAIEAYCASKRDDTEEMTTGWGLRGHDASRGGSLLGGAYHPLHRPAAFLLTVTLPISLQQRVVSCGVRHA